MAVAFDANMTGGNGVGGKDQNASAATSVTTSTAITVGSQATLLVVTITWGSSASVDPSARTCTWKGVSMTEGPTVGVTDGGAHRERVSIFTLVNPAAGQNTLTASWTGSCDAYMSATSFKGANGIATADSITATATTSISVTSELAGATVACFAVDGSTPTTNFNQIYAEAPLTPGGGASYQLGGASNAHTFTGAGGTIQALAGIHILAGPPSARSCVRITLDDAEDEGRFNELNIRNWWMEAFA